MCIPPERYFYHFKVVLNESVTIGHYKLSKALRCNCHSTVSIVSFKHEGRQVSSSQKVQNSQSCSRVEVSIYRSPIFPILMHSMLSIDYLISGERPSNSRIFSQSHGFNSRRERRVSLFLSFDARRSFFLSRANVNSPWTNSNARAREFRSL